MNNKFFQFILIGFNLLFIIFILFFITNNMKSIHGYGAEGQGVDLPAMHDAPVGSILAWHKNITGLDKLYPGLKLPAGWVECNGQKINDSKSVIKEIPDLNNAPASYNHGGFFLRGSLHSGDMTTDTFQSHWHYWNFSPEKPDITQYFDVAKYVIRPLDVDAQSKSDINKNEAVKNPVSDIENIDPRTSSETRPINMSVVWIMKIY